MVAEPVSRSRKRDTVPVPLIDVSSRRRSARVAVVVMPSNGKKPASPSLESETVRTAVGSAGELSAGAAEAAEPVPPEAAAVPEPDPEPALLPKGIEGIAPQPASRAAAAVAASRKKRVRGRVDIRNLVWRGKPHEATPLLRGRQGSIGGSASPGHPRAGGSRAALNILRITGTPGPAARIPGAPP